MFFLNIIFSLVVLFQVVGAWANDEHSGATSPPAEDSSPSSGRGVVEVEARISFLESKVKTKENNIRKLIDEKNNLKEQDPRVKDIINEIAKEDRERHQAASDLEKERIILNYRFPERGSKGKRKYHKVDLKSVHEIEGSMSVEERLQRSLKKMRSQYGSENEEKPKEKPTPSEEAVDKQGPIILQK